MTYEDFSTTNQEGDENMVDHPENLPRAINKSDMLATVPVKDLTSNNVLTTVANCHGKFQSHAHNNTILTISLNSKLL